MSSGNHWASRTVKQPESTAAASLQKTKGFGEKGELSSKFGPTKYKWMKRNTNPGPVLMAESELSPSVENHSCLGRSQKPQ